MLGASPEALRLGLALTLALLLVLVLGCAFQAWLRRRQLRSRFQKARKGESQARELLEAQGYAVIGSQSQRSYILTLDGAEMQIPLRADYLVSRDGRRYVAEVKTGAHAPQIRTGATRRQLLEYLVAFDVDGVLLVDAEQKRVHVVRFPLAAPHPSPGLWPAGWVAIGIGVAAFVAVLWR